VENRHYLYRHIRPDKDKVFYIGIGTKQYGDLENVKKTYARAYSKNLKTDFWKRIVAKSGYYVKIMKRKKK